MPDPHPDSPVSQDHASVPHGPCHTADGRVTQHPAVAALLAVTPVDFGGLVAESYGSSPGYGCPPHVVMGDPEPIAARQAAAVLRWAAGEARDEASRPGYSTNTVNALAAFARFLDEEAGDIDAQYRTEGATP